MKSHKTKDQCFENFLATVSRYKQDDLRAAFEAGWYACAREINEGEDSDWLQERLYEEGFLQKDNEDDE